MNFPVKIRAILLPSSGFLLSVFFTCLALLVSLPFFKTFDLCLKTSCLKNDVHILKAGNDVYRIPTFYNPTIRESKERGGYAQFSLQLLIPDLSPLNANSQDGVHYNMDQGLLLANVEYGIDLDDPQSMFLRLVQNYKEVAEQSTEHSPALRLFKNLSGGGMPELYAKENAGQVVFLFQCLAEGGAPYPYCQVFEKIRDHMSIQYYFSRRYINSATAIDKKLRDLILSFKVQSENNK